MPLLARARNGIEFFGLSDQATDAWHKIKQTKGLERFAAFTTFVSQLARWSDYKLLSHAQLQSVDDDAQLNQIESIVSRITEDLTQQLSAADLAAELEMTESGSLIGFVSPEVLRPNDWRVVPVRGAAKSSPPRRPPAPTGPVKL